MIQITGNVASEAVIIHNGRIVGSVQEYRIYINGKFIAECDGYADALRIARETLG